MDVCLHQLFHPTMRTALNPVLTSVNEQRTNRPPYTPSAASQLFLRLHPTAYQLLPTSLALSRSSAVRSDDLTRLQPPKRGTEQSSGLQLTAPVGAITSDIGRSDYVAPDFCPATDTSCACMCYPAPHKHRTAASTSTSTSISTTQSTDTIPSSPPCSSPFDLFLQHVRSTDSSSTLEAAQQLFVDSNLQQLCNTPDTAKWVEQYTSMLRTAVSQIKESLHARLRFVETCYALRVLCHSVTSNTAVDDTASKLWCIVRHQIVLASKRYTIPGDKAHRYFFDRLQRDCNVIAKYRAAGVDQRCLADMASAGQWTNWTKELVALAAFIQHVIQLPSCNGQASQLVVCAEFQTVEEMIASVKGTSMLEQTNAIEAQHPERDAVSTSQHPNNVISAHNNNNNNSDRFTESPSNASSDAVIAANLPATAEDLPSPPAASANDNVSSLIQPEVSQTLVTSHRSRQRSTELDTAPSASDVSSASAVPKSTSAPTDEADATPPTCITLSQLVSSYHNFPTQLRKVKRQRFLEAVQSQAEHSGDDQQCEYWLDERTQTMVCVVKPTQQTGQNR